jgi:taurine dioxygenase
MARLKVRDLRNDLTFGSIVEGVNEAALADPDVRAEINDIFVRRGMIVFTGCEPIARFQVELSTVFGPLKDHPTKSTARADDNAVPGVIDMHYQPDPETGDLGLVEVAGRKVAIWSNWHFDHCYNDELNYAGVLRSLIAVPEGGLTGFADGIAMYEAIPRGLRDAIAKYNIIYMLDVRRSKMRFGRPAGFRCLGDTEYILGNVREGLTFPRAMHPAVWTRPTGEKVLHISPWMAFGLEGNETPEGEALLEEVCQTMIANARPYWHKWEPDHMVIWDNHRMLHAVSGHDPGHERRMQRTTIRGDYGLGYFEDSKKIGEVQREFIA